MKFTTLATLFCSQALAIHVSNENIVPLNEEELQQLEHADLAEVNSGLNDRSVKSLMQQSSAQSDLVEADESEAATDPLSEGYWHKYLMMPDKYPDLEYEEVEYTCGMTKSTYKNTDTGEYFMYLI